MIVSYQNRSSRRLGACHGRSNAVPGFLPSTNGLRFANRFPPGPTVRLGPLDPRWIGIGDASAGLCGGMSWYVRERFEAGLPIPPDTSAGQRLAALSGARPAPGELARLAPDAGRFWWMGAVGAASALQRTVIVESACARRHRCRAASMVGLVRHTGLNPFSMTMSHQVLAFAYEATATP